MKIQKAKLSSLKPLEQNVRKHSENQIAELIRSVEQFGQTRAIVIDEKSNILIGNGLYAAMVKAGLDEAFVYRKSGLSEIEKKKLILADNKTYTLGTDDYGNIEAYLEEITATGDFDIAGFDEDVLRNLMREADEVLQDVQSYGVLPADIVEKKKAVKEEREEEAATAPPDDNEAQAAANGYSDASDAADNKTDAEPVQTVICPACGECIPLD